MNVDVKYTILKKFENLFDFTSLQLLFLEKYEVNKVYLKRAEVKKARNHETKVKKLLEIRIGQLLNLERS